MSNIWTKRLRARKAAQHYDVRKRMSAYWQEYQLDSKMIEETSAGWRQRPRFSMCQVCERIRSLFKLPMRWSSHLHPRMVLLIIYAHETVLVYLGLQKVIGKIWPIYLLPPFCIHIFHYIEFHFTKLGRIEKGNKLTSVKTTDCLDYSNISLYFTCM